MAPPGRHRPSVVGLAVVVGLIQFFITRAAADDQDPARTLDLAGHLLLLVGPAGLLLRRRAPVAGLAVALAATTAYALAGYPRGPYFLAPIFAVFAVVTAGRRAAGWLLVGIAYVVFLLAPVLPGVPAQARPGVAQAAVVAVWAAGVLVLAEAVRVRSQHRVQVAGYLAAKARSRAEQERRQASEERLRIARELHDVLGHHLSLINVQAGVGLHLMDRVDSRPEQAREALTAIKTASAEALREVRAVLGVLRPEEEAAPRAPAPGLDRLDELTGEAGLPVRVAVEGPARPLPPEVDRAAYRIVQEALTNVRRHAGSAASAIVTIGYGPGEVTVRVEDDGDAPATGKPAGGRGETVPGETVPGEAVPGSGIAGMRARATALGGRLAAGPGESGGFRVEASLPTADRP